MTRAGKFAYGSCLASLKHLSVSMRANISEPCLRASQNFVTNLTRCSDVSFYKIHARIQNLFKKSNTVNGEASRTYSLCLVVCLR